MTWQKIVKQLGEEKTSLVLMYLALGEDYPYNMADKNFSIELTEEKGWSRDLLTKLKSLKDASQLSRLLKQMEKERLIISRNSEVNGRKRHIYRLNPLILCNISNLSITSKPPEFEIMGSFLGELSKKEREPYFEVWKEMNPLEYITFINFLEIESEELGMYDVMSILGKIFDDHFDMKRFIAKMQGRKKHPSPLARKIKEKAGKVN